MLLAWSVPEQRLEGATGPWPSSGLCRFPSSGAWKYKWFEEARVDRTVNHGYIINLKSGIVFFDWSMHLYIYPPALIQEELGKVSGWLRYVERFGTIAMIPQMTCMEWMGTVSLFLALISLRWRKSHLCSTQGSQYERLVSRWTLQDGQEKTIVDSITDLQEA